MGRQRYTLHLTRKQQAYLADFVQSETISRQQRNRAQVLQHWLTDLSAQESGEQLGLSIDRVYSMRRAFTQQGFKGYLHEVPRCGAPNKLTPKVEAALQKMVQLPTKGKRLTLQQLAQRLVDQGHAERICTLTVHKALKRLKTATQQPELSPCALTRPQYATEEQAA